LKALGYLFATAALSAVVSASSAATLYSTNFETDQSANFTTVVTSADTEANFAFDYGTWVPTSPTAPITSITLAPNSSAGGTKGLKLRSNFDPTGTVEAVSVFVNAANSLTSWSLTFDAFQMWNGADLAATGTTTAFVIGNSDATKPLYAGAGATLNGWFIFMTGEGGQGSNDARYYSGTGAAPTEADTTPNWAINGGTALPINTPGAAGTWDSIFTAANYQVAGTPGRQWVTWELICKNNIVTISVTPVGGPKVQIATWAQVANQKLGLGFWDHNNGSVAAPPEDNFVVIDNLKLETAPVSAAGATDWGLFQ
jgi:hypothetical protein